MTPRPVERDPGRPAPGLPPDRLALRHREAAETLGVSERTLWAWTKAGAVPCVKLGGRTLYPTDALRDWLNQLAAGQGGRHDPH